VFRDQAAATTAEPNASVNTLGIVALSEKLD
jgi:hypothetical protein